MTKVEAAILATRKYYAENKKPWIVGFSGGKDSSLVVKIMLSALSSIPTSERLPLRIMYCDTGVEIPILSGYIKESLAAVEAEANLMSINTVSEIVKPRISDMYFVKVIGRGYPPPTNKFRWCTDKLRIDPIQRAVQSHTKNEETVVVLGTRYGESLERTRRLNKHATQENLVFTQSGYPGTTLFCPIANFSTDDVWEGLIELEQIKSINLNKLSNLYKQISGECPIIKLPDANPCSKGRFGCWTCTVVRKDKATTNLIDSGFTELKPLLGFRTWLLEVRDLPEFRCSIRRNGAKGLGPFRLASRKIILKKLLQAEQKSGFKLIDEQEIAAIHELWTTDKVNTKYRED